jgi:hypothetical protein
MNPAANYIIGSCRPWKYGYIRREYTRNLQDGHGDYFLCAIHGLRMIEGESIWFQCMLMDQHGGAGFMAPIEAFCWKIPDQPRVKGEPVDMTMVQPWDVFSSSFGVHEFEFHRHMQALILPKRTPAAYWFSIDFAESSLAENADQHKHLHVFELEDGSIGAFPNTRVIWNDPAFCPPTQERPDFISLAGEFRAEGVLRPQTPNEPRASS